MLDDKNDKSTSAETSNPATEKTTESTVEQQNESKSPKKGSNKFISIIRNAGSALEKRIEKSFEKASAYINRKELDKSKREAFYAECDTYLIVRKTDFWGKEYQIKASRDRSAKELFFLNDEPHLSEIHANTRLKNIADQSEIQIQEVDKKDFYFPITIAEIQYELVGKKASYDFFKAQNMIQNITNSTTQNVNISGTNYGDISQNVNIEQQLAQIEGEIKNCKGRLFAFKKKDAEQLFGSFKSCILTNQKDENLFKKFLKILGDLSLNIAVSLVKQLIFTTFNLQI